jgi:hypothetical protein
MGQSQSKKNPPTTTQKESPQQSNPDQPRKLITTIPNQARNSPKDNQNEVHSGQVIETDNTKQQIIDSDSSSRQNDPIATLADDNTAAVTTANTNLSDDTKGDTPQQPTIPNDQNGDNQNDNNNNPSLTEHPGDPSIHNLDSSGPGVSRVSDSEPQTIDLDDNIDDDNVNNDDEITPSSSRNDNEFNNGDDENGDSNGDIKPANQLPQSVVESARRNNSNRVVISPAGNVE